MKNNVKLYKLKDSELNQILNMINSDEELKNTFFGGDNTIQRVLDSIYSAVIKVNNETVGFIMITNNPRTNKDEIDMGILTDYRNMGYGSKALELLKRVIFLNKLNVEVQIQKKNKPAIKSVLNNGFTLYRQDKTCNYYIINEDRKSK